MRANANSGAAAPCRAVTEPDTMVSKRTMDEALARQAMEHLAEMACMANEHQADLRGRDESIRQIGEQLLDAEEMLAADTAVAGQLAEATLRIEALEKELSAARRSGSDSLTELRRRVLVPKQDETARTNAALAAEVHRLKAEADRHRSNNVRLARFAFQSKEVFQSVSRTLSAALTGNLPVAEARRALALIDGNLNLLGGQAASTAPAKK